MDDSHDGWRRECETDGVDPAIVEEAADLFGRYRAYTLGNGGKPLDLVTWFRYYAAENASSLSTDRIAVDGCSVDERSVAPPGPARTAAIFRLLERLLQLRA